MALQFRVWLYGSRPEVAKSKTKKKTSVKKSSTSKKLVRLSEDELRYAKGFHLFIKKPRGSWVRVTQGIEPLPSGVRSNVDKEIYIELYQGAIEEALAPKKKEPKKKEPKKPEPKPKPEPKKKKEIETLHLPDLPDEPRVSITKAEFKGQMNRIIADELFGETPWPARRRSEFLERLWKKFSHAPHLLLSEEFRRGLVSTEIENRRTKEVQAKNKLLQEEFRKSLSDRPKTVKSDIGGDVTVQIKEVFDKQNMSKSTDMKRNMFDTSIPGASKIVEVDRQQVFGQVIANYDKIMKIESQDLLKNTEKSKNVLGKLEADVRQLYKESLEKGVFKQGKDEFYSVRLVMPLVNSKGDVPESYKNLKGEKTSGYGYSTERREIKNEEDFEEMMSSVFDELNKVMGRYVRLNHSAGIGVAGFMIERSLS